MARQRYHRNPKVPLNAGTRLKSRRKELGLSLRDVHLASLEIVANGHNEEFTISRSRLCALEGGQAVPNIYRLYSLALIYQLDLLEMLSWFGINARA